MRSDGQTTPGPPRSRIGSVGLRVTDESPTSWITCCYVRSKRVGGSRRADHPKMALERLPREQSDWNIRIAFHQPAELLGTSRARARSGRCCATRRLVHEGLVLRRARRLVKRTGCDVVRSRSVSLTVLNPATEEAIATLDQAGVDETDAAVARARAAFPAWRAVSPADRGRLLRRLATLVEEHHEELVADRVAERRQADRRRPRRGRHGRRRLPLLRRRRRQEARRDDPRRGRHRHDVPRAARRRRADRPVELPAQHLVLEARPCARHAATPSCSSPPS